MGDADAGSELVFSLCHEVGNLLGAIRLNAHLIDETASPVELATASVEIDDSSARIRSLLALVRPLLAPAAEDAEGVSAEAWVAGVGEALDEYGGHGVDVEVGPAKGLPRVRGRSDLLHHLLVTFGYCAVEEARPRGRVSLRASRAGSRVVVGIEDDGRWDEALGMPHADASTGRPLVCEIARALLGRFDGEVQVEREGGVTRIELALPALD